MQGYSEQKASILLNIDRVIDNAPIMHEESHKGLILRYMQKHFDRAFRGIDFDQRKLFGFTPFVGQSANCRLSDLKTDGLIEKVGEEETVGKRHKNLFLYKITEAGMQYKKFRN